jgi:hypothetical protein
MSFIFILYSYNYYDHITIIFKISKINIKINIKIKIKIKIKINIKIKIKIS